LNHPLVTALDYHGPDGLGKCSLPSPELPPCLERAWDFTARLIMENPGEVALLATGPLTNVAHAFRCYPELPELLAKLVLMGGAYGMTSYGKGNQTPFAEFNIWQDPEVACTVFNSGMDIFAVGLDVSMNPAACLNSRHLERIKDSHAKAARLAEELVEYAISRHGCCAMHDPLALAVLLDTSLFKFDTVRVEVIKGDNWDRGITRVSLGEEASGLPLVHVASDVDGARFLELFLSRISEE